MTNDSELLAEIAEDYTVRLRNEDQPSIDVYVDKHPSLADDIRKLLPSIRAMEQLSHREHSERKFERKTKRLTLAPDGLLGDFKILGEIGRGGMGVVYEAEQQSLKRRVALKILGPTMAGSPKQLARFQSEAKAVAKLHHTNIVSVHGVGEHEGLYYYAMQLIDGMTLSEAIATAEPDGDFVTRHGVPDSQDEQLPLIERPTDIRDPKPAADPTQPIDETTELKTSTDSTKPRQLNDINRSLHAATRWTEIARLGADVADALHYAHSRGVLHRDIKPSNLILDRAGDIWITDFGLAHHEDMDGVTATGDIVGTVRYMAPEQFDGQFDARCDTYALGMTIYEMLTLRPAFSGPPKQIIKLKTTSAPPTPRSINPAIPRDLETIVLKACASNPAKRYEAPDELAADLRRFLQDRPIHARRVTWRERLYRWARRNPLAAALGLLSLVSVASAFAVFAFFNFELSEKNQSLKEQQRQAAFKTLLAESYAGTSGKLSLEYQQHVRAQMAAVQHRGLPEPVIWELDTQHPVSLGVLSQSDLASLRNQLAFSLRIGDVYEDKQGIEEAAALELGSAGEIFQMLGQYDDAATQYVEAAKRLKGLLKLSNTIDLTTSLARMHARIEEVRGRVVDQKIIPAEAGGQIGKRLIQEDPGNILTSEVEAQYEFVRVVHSNHYAMLQKLDRLNLIGNQHKTVDLPPEAVGDNDLAISYLAGLTRDSDDTAYRILSIRIQTDRGRIELLRGKKERALLHFNNAARDIGEMLFNKETREIRSSLILELGYVLCLAPDVVQDVHRDDVVSSLGELIKKLKTLQDKDRRANPRSGEIIAVAKKRLELYQAQ